MKIKNMAAAVSVAGLLVAGMAGPAQAGKPFEKVTAYSEHFAFDHNDCGLDLHVEADVSGKFSIHPAPRSDEAFLGHDRYQFTETITLVGDPDGAFVTTAAHGNWREIRAELLDPAEPTIYAFTAIDAGRFQMFDSSGAPIFAGNGLFRQTVTFDTLGDGVPGAEFIEVVSEVFHGHETGDFCEVVVEALTGA